MCCNYVTVDRSLTDSTASKYEELELASDQSVVDGKDDVTSTTALAGSFASNAAAAGLVETATLTTNAGQDAADAEVHL